MSLKQSRVVWWQTNPWNCCADFTKADVAKGGKENILVLTDAFSKYSQAFVTPNQKSSHRGQGPCREMVQCFWNSSQDP